MINNHYKIMGYKSGIEARYSYITNTNDLYSTLLQSHRDMNESLMKEIKRDRYIVNAKQLEKVITTTLNEEMAAVSKEMVNVVSDGVMDQVNHSMNQISSGSRLKSDSSFSAQFGKALGKALGNATTKIVNDVITGKI